LQLQPGQRVSVHFMQNPPRVRNLRVSGIYNTGLEEFDKQFALIDIRHIQALNEWSEFQVSGFEIFLKNPELMNETCDLFNYEILSADLVARTIREIYPNIFDWLALQDMNKLIILILMTIVACINMVTCLLIIILERSSMIGALKAMGATHWSIRMIFVYNALYIVTAGIMAGNLAGLTLCYLQHRFKFITLPETSYYTPYAPVDINLWHIAAIDVATLVICFLVLLLPSYLVSRISPSKVLRFE
jgi:lipoprotein-releasing system permease protein